MKGSLRALTREYLVGNQTEQILGWHFGNFEKWAGFTLTALNNPYDPEERLITDCAERNLLLYHGRAEV